MRNLIARWRQPLRDTAILVIVGAVLACAAAGALPFLPTQWQRATTALLPWVPGIDEVVDMSGGGTDFRAERSLRATWGGARLVTLPADESQWDDDAAGLQVAFPFFVLAAAWGAVLGLLVAFLRGAPEARTPLALGVVVGAVLGIAVALSLPHLPGGWSALWLRALSALPGVARAPASADALADGQLVPLRALHSSGGVVAEHPASALPWPRGADVVRVPASGKTWFAAWGVLGALGVALLIGARRARTWRWRTILVGVGAGVLAWMALAVAPRGLQRAVLGTAERLPLVTAGGPVGVAAPTEETAAVEGDAAVEGGEAPAPEAGEQGESPGSGETDDGAAVVPAAAAAQPPAVVQESALRRLSLLGVELARTPGPEGDWSWPEGGVVRIRLALLALLAVTLCVLLAPVGLMLAGVEAARGGLARRRRAKQEAAEQARWHQPPDEVHPVAAADETSRDEIKADLDSWLGDPEE